MNHPLITIDGRDELVNQSYSDDKMLLPSLKDVVREPFTDDSVMSEEDVSEYVDQLLTAKRMQYDEFYYGGSKSVTDDLSDEIDNPKLE